MSSTTVTGGCAASQRREVSSPEYFMKVSRLWLHDSRKFKLKISCFFCPFVLITAYFYNFAVNLLIYRQSAYVETKSLGCGEAKTSQAHSRTISDDGKVKVSSHCRFRAARRKNPERNCKSSNQIVGVRLIVERYKIKS